MIKLLFIGDIVSKVGRNVVKQNISSLRSSYEIDLVIANGENAAHGKGITEKLYKELIECGIEVITMGNHTFSKDNIFDFIEEADCLVRPLNLEPLDLGYCYALKVVKGQTICVYNVLGNVFMNSEISPFGVTDQLLKAVKADIYICDFHGEATSEKILYAFNYQNKVQTVIGTHTHVQTADERLIGKLAFISDVGMCGAYYSVLGRDVQETMQRLVFKEATHFKVAEGPAIFCGVVVTIDEITKSAIAIERVQIRPDC
jgi:metallophosphoesterase (TIGR00282 family)